MIVIPPPPPPQPPSSPSLGNTDQPAPVNQPVHSQQKAPQSPSGNRPLPPPPTPTDNKQKDQHGTSQEKTAGKEDSDKSKSENQTKQKENQSSIDESQPGNKKVNQSDNQTDLEKDVKNKHIQRNIKHLDSKLFATAEMPELEKAEEKELSESSSVVKTKTSDTSSVDERRKANIKQSVINEIGKGQRGKPPLHGGSKTGVVRKTSLSKKVTNTDDRKSTLQHRNSKGVLQKGSNVTRSLSSGSSSESLKPAQKARNTTNSRWTWDDPELGTALMVKKVNKSNDEIMPEPTKEPKSMASKSRTDERNSKPRSAEKKLDKVHPKRIVVKPKEDAHQSPQRRASVTVTGTALGSGSSPDRPLPERTPSKVCNIQ